MNNYEQRDESVTSFCIAALCMLLVLFARLPALAQATQNDSPRTTASLPAVPTMDQTIAFLKEKMVNRAQYPQPNTSEQLTLVGGCTLVYETVSETRGDACTSAVKTGSVLALYLGGSDPLSISIVPDGNPLPVRDTIRIERADGFETTAKYNPGQPALSCGSPEEYSDIVVSRTATELVYITSEHDVKRILINPPGGSEQPHIGKVQRDKIGATAYAKASLSEIVPGDSLIVSLDTSKHGEKTLGIVIYDKDHQSVPELPTETSFRTTIQAAENRAHTTEARHFLHPLDYMTFVDSEKSDAERVSKALIHAMVLCRKSEVPSLF